MVSDLGALFTRIRQLSRRIYVRVGLVAVLSLLAVGLAPLLSPFIPDGFASNIGADSVGPILDILASSMLGVTTFSLTIMVAGFTKATSQWTPRSQLILREDTVTHTVLANFVGAYLYSLNAIILRTAGVFDHRDIVVLFGMTLVVVTLVVLSLIRWIIHLEGLGSLGRTADAIETQALAAIRREATQPNAGGRALTDPLTQIPQGAITVCAQQAGYLRQVFDGSLQSLAKTHDAGIFVAVPVGTYVHKGAPLAHIALPSGRVDDAMAEAICSALPLSPARNFEQDPAFGLSVLTEIGVRALSPGINDPATAVDVAHRLGRLLEPLANPMREKPRCDRLWIAPVTMDRLMFEAFDPLARNAGTALEVYAAIMNTLRHLQQARNPALASAAKRCYARCKDRAGNAGMYVSDIDYMIDLVGKKLAI